MNKTFTPLTGFHRYVAKACMMLALLPALPVFGANGVWTNVAGGSWANPANWAGGIIANGVTNIADFTTVALPADATVTLDGNFTNGFLSFGDTTGLHNWFLNGGTGGVLTLTTNNSVVASGPNAVISVTNNQTVTISFPIAGSVGLDKSGNGTLVFTGTNTVVGSSVYTNGTVTYSGNGANADTGGVNGAQYLYLGSNNGRTTLNMNSTNTVNYGDSNSKIYVGGTSSTGPNTDTGQGEINQTSGTLNLNVGQNLRVASGGPNSYGGLNLQGGTMNIGGTAQIGCGGVGVFNQSGGVLTGTKYFGIGEYAGSVGVATFTGGTATFSTGGSSDISIGDGGSATTFATFNVGTLAGGTAVVTAANVGNATYRGTRMGSASGLTANLNLDNGAFVVNNLIYRNNTGANAYLNFEGGTLRAGANCTVVSNNLSAAYVFRDGAVIDSQGFTATCLANLQPAAGNGIYPTGGGWAYTSGAGYIGVPYVTVSGGSGSGASAVATISGGQVTGVVMTCPGQGYAAGDVLTFAFSGGSPTTPATSYVYTLTSGDVSNTAGGLTKLGSGTLNLAGTNTYTGTTTVSAGTLVVSPVNGAAPGNYTVATGSKLIARQTVAGTQMAVNAMTFNAGSTLTLDEASLSGPLVVVTNALTSSATVSINLTNMTISTGQYPLISYGTLGGAGFSGFSLGAVPASIGLAFSLSNNVANHSIDLVAVTATSVVWNGNVSGVWDIGGTPNWQGNEYYAQSGGVGPAVTFDDTASGTTTITLNTTVSPFATYINNSSLTYALGGSGNITGSGVLVKQGSGTFTLATANALTNVTTISAGTLQLGDGSANNGSVGGNIADNAALVIANPAAQSVNNLISGTGTLAKSGAGTLTLTSSNTLSGSVAVNAGTLALNPGGVSGGVPVLPSVSGVTIASGGALTLTGNSSLGYSNTVVPAVTVQDGGALSATGSGQQYFNGLSVGNATVSGAGNIFDEGDYTNTSSAQINAGNFSCAGTNIFFANQSALTVNTSFNLVPGNNATYTYLDGDPNNFPGGTLTTLGNVNVTRTQLELENMTWNIDLGTNSLYMTSKFIIGANAGQNVYVEWLSGNGFMAINNYFTMGDGPGGSIGEFDMYGGSLVVSNTGTRVLIGNGGNGTMNVSGGTLSFVGNASIQVGGDSSYAQNGASGTLIVSNTGAVIIGAQSGGLRVAADKAGAVSGVTGTIDLNGGTLTSWPSIVNATTNGSAYINFNGGKLKAGTNNATFLQGFTQATVQPGGAIISDGGYNVIIGQALTDGGGGLTKLGAGILALTNASTYSGSTTISNGTLEVDGSIAGSGVSVVQGNLAGIGTVGASVTVGSTGAIAPGTNGLGVLTINGNLQLGGSVNIAVNKSLAQPNGAAIVSGTITNTGTGIVTITNGGPAFVAGDTFTLFNQPVVNGNALTIPTVGGVVWTNLLALNGTIQVLSVAPTINPLAGPLQYSVSAGQLSLSWPTNLGWILQSETNPVSAGLSTNWSAVAGSTAVTNITVGVDKVQGAVFYRLVHP